MIRHSLKFIVLAFALINFAGCANMEGIMSNMGMGPYTEGTEVTDAQMDTFVAGKTTYSQIKAELGEPTREGNGKMEYDFIKVPHFGPNENYTAVFVVSRKGVLVSHEKTQGTAKTDNELLNQHYGLQ